jgi:hypothetical protein
VLLGIRIEEDGVVRHVLADPNTGEVREAPWSSGGPASWQRVAP